MDIADNARVRAWDGGLENVQGEWGYRPGGIWFEWGA